MTIHFYSCGDDPRKLTKTLTPVTSLDCVLYGENSKSNPRLKLNYDSALMVANYCFIPEFDRYYTFTIDTLPNGAIELVCVCDYRLSYADDIRLSKGRLIRSNSGSKYMVDPLAEKTSRSSFQYRILGTCFEPNITYCIVKGS